MKAILITRDESGQHARLSEMDDSALPGPEAGGEVLVDVDYSTINYKDGLALTGKAPVVRSFPMVPGIDFAGTVRESSSTQWKRGDAVILNGWGVGESHWGGLAQRARVRADWLIRRPAGMDARTTMALGTAGYTAMLCVPALQRHGLTPDSGPVLVTGASGGVGSVAISLLSRLGFRVVASTGRAGEAAYLTTLGAAEVIDRTELSKPGKALGKERWAGVVDIVGSTTLANACATTRYGGAVTACGLAGGMDLPATVAPFILRGVTLYGIDSVMAPRPVREAAWQRLAAEADAQALAAITTQAGLADAPALGADILQGRVRGRVVIDVNQ